MTDAGWNSLTIKQREYNLKLWILRCFQENNNMVPHNVLYNFYLIERAIINNNEEPTLTEIARKWGYIK